jgi:hypothetical protein
MKETRISLPELALVAITRVGLGFGIGLLTSGRMSRRQRRAVGISMVLVGAVTTIPLAIAVRHGRVKEPDGHAAARPRMDVDAGLMAD